MGLFRYLDKKMKLDSQKSYIKTFIYFGVPIGYLFGQVLKIISNGWSEYHFSLGSLLFLLFLDFLIILPMMLHYNKHIKRYKKLKDTIIHKNKKYKLRARFSYDDFEKGDSYDVIDTYTGIFILDSEGYHRNLESIMNRFELDDIRLDRIKKLKQLNKKTFWQS